MNEHAVVKDFAALLRGEENDAKRAALVKRAQMLALNELPEAAFEPPVTALGDYLDTPIPVPPSLVWPTIVVRGELTTTLGRAGKGKTTMNLNRILKWAAGRPMFDAFKDPDGEAYLKPSEPLKTLIIENEGSAGMFHHKMGTMLNNNEGLLSEDDRALIRENVYIWGDGGYSGLKLDDPAMLSRVRAGVEKVKPDILFVEPFRGLWKGEENSATDMAVVIDNLIGLATDYGCGVVLSHHERKSGAGEDGEMMSAGRGSTVLEGAVAVMENFQSVRSGDYRELTWSKARYLQPPVPARLEYDRDTGWYRYVALDVLETSILLELERSDEPLSIRDLVERTDEKEHKLRKVMKKLKEEMRVKSTSASFDAEIGRTTGERFRLPGDDSDDDFGGLAVG